MPRELFHRELRTLRDEVLVLGSMTEEAIRRAVESLQSGDHESAHKIIAGDLEINKKRFEIEEICLQIVATQAPMAQDLRTIVAVLYIIADLERMADHAEGIARITILLGNDQSVAPFLPRMSEMAEKAVDMLSRSISAFVNHDADSARRICRDDDDVDAMYDALYRDVIAEMIRQSGEVRPLTYMLWTAHNLERIADRSTNICERVIFLVSGRMEEINVSRY